MTTLHSSQPGLPAYKYPQHVERVLTAHRSPHILGQNRAAYSRGYRDAGYRRRVGLEVAQDPRPGLRLAGLCALLVAVLCAWMFFNANFATP